MQMEQQLTFGPYRFAPQIGQLWRGTQEVKLTPKATAVLRYVIERRGQVVTKEDLFAAVWPGTVVSDAALTSCIQELRQALHDNARKPRYLGTVYRRGFRFLGKVVSGQQLVVSNEDREQGARSRESESKIPLPSLVPPTQHIDPVLVGREPDLVFLHARLAKALHGERQLVFVTGEPGIGKTTVVEAFIQGLVSSAQRHDDARQRARGREHGAKINTLSLAPSSQLPAPCFARGQCIEHYGAGEAYLPILEALGRLCREVEGKDILALLRQHAPSWLVQLPSFLSTLELEDLQRRTVGATRDRMLRELAEALEVLTAEQPLVLVLEDLHWSDVSTLDLLSMLARRQEPARLLILGTYRPVEVLTRDHPLKGIKQELQVHGQCEELALDFLSESAVAEYLTQRFGIGAVREPPLQRLAQFIHQRTDGNSLFMVNVTNELVARAIITNRDGQWKIQDTLADNTMGVPENLRQLIVQQLGRLNSDERRILEAASVAGAEFSATAVAAGTEHSTEVVETHCDSLVRHEQFLRTQGTSEWPDGTVAARYGFTHALYQEVLYEQLSASRRIRLHRQIGEREEQAYGDRAREIAAELAVHFERGRDAERAVHYRQQAGENALRRSADHEAANHFTKGLELLRMLPDTPQRALQELTLQLALGTALTSTKGYAAPELKQTYLRAQELSQQLGNTTQLFSALSGLRRYYAMRTEHKTADALADQLLQIAEDARDSDLLIEAHVAKGNTVIWLGEFLTTRRHFEQGLALYDSQQHRTHAFLYGQDPAVACLSQLAQVLWLLGYPDQARQRGHQAIHLAQELSHPNSLGYALDCTAMCHQLRREPRETQELAEATVRLGIEHGFPYWETQGTMLLGSALAEQGQIAEGLTQMTQGFAAHQAIGGRILEQYWLALQVEAYQKIGQVEEAIAVLAEAMTVAVKSGECFWEAELYRLKGELTLQQKSTEHGARSKRSKEFTVRSEQQNSEETDPQGAAEACFLTAIEISRKQQAKSLELRATMSLARLRQQQALRQRARSKGVRARLSEQETRTTHHETRNRLAEAHKMLSGVYHWFTEGFDTKDLQEAKTLLNELKEKVDSGERRV